jgi:multiple sugar transport system substrate-binding protein
LYVHANPQDPSNSKVAGLVEAADCPKEDARLTKADCGYGETPGISRQGGSCLALSRYAPNADAAWIFMRWATSADVTARANAQGANTPTRKSDYLDPRVKEKNKPGLGTTRHFEVTRRAIETRMGTSPHLPVWATLASDVNAVEYGKMTTRQQSIEQTLKVIQEKTEKALANLRLAEQAPLHHQPRIPHEEQQQRRDDDARNRHLSAHDLAAVRQDIGVDQADQKCRQ